MGLDPLPGFTPPRESPVNPSELSQRYPLAFISPPHRHFLNSSFANLDFALKDAGVPTLEIHPDDAAKRGIAENTEVRVFNDRGEYTVRARITDRVRRGVVSAPSVWWKKLSPDKRNANELTSQAVADMGGAATYYDCLVEVAPAI
jgi:anaerobic selenocysteine-containing dehydrogenase